MSSNTWVCVASGPSLREEDIDYCREKGWHLATCNMNFQTVPDAEVYVAADYKFWDTYGNDVLATLRPECKKWCGCHQTVTPKGIGIWYSLPHRGFAKEYGHVCCGGPSGYFLIQATYWEAVKLCAREPDRIILLGYDNAHGPNGERHYHPDYPKGFSNAHNPDRWLRAYECMATEAPVRIINASRATALTMFELTALEQLG